jgi:hypothetical protein
MLLPRPAIAADPRMFGKRFDASSAPQESAGVSLLAADVRLFALTFGAGFLFVSILLA